MPEEMFADQATEAKTVKVQVYLEPSKFERLKRLANYAANESIIPAHPRGLISGFFNWAFSLADEQLRQHALGKRGYS